MMYKNRIATIILILVALIATSTCFATDTLKNKYPAVLLVQLRSEHNRIEALTKARMYQEVKEVENDARQVRSRMIMDFETNFNYCPVYYYIDTNADLIKQKVFDGVLMNADGTKARNLVINKSSDNYVIVFYGYSVDDARVKFKVADSSKYLLNTGEPSGKGIIINNDKFQQIGYIYKLGTDDIFIGKRNKLYYNSKHYDVDYFPLVKYFNAKLKERAGATTSRYND